MRAKTFPCSLACRYYAGCCSAGSRRSDFLTLRNSGHCPFAFIRSKKLEQLKFLKKQKVLVNVCMKYIFLALPVQSIWTFSNQKAVFGCVSLSCCCCQDCHSGSSCPQLSSEDQAPHQGTHHHVSCDQMAPRKLPTLDGLHDRWKRSSRKGSHPLCHQADSRHMSHYRFNKLKSLVLKKIAIKCCLVVVFFFYFPPKFHRKVLARIPFLVLGSRML